MTDWDTLPSPQFYARSAGLLYLIVIAAGGDLHILLKSVYGHQRIARHLWRMCFGLWIATSAIFIGQPQMFPDWMRHWYLVFIPSLLIPILAIYRLVVAFFTRSFKRRAAVAPLESPAGA